MMKKYQFAAAGLAVAIGFAAQPAMAGDPKSCASVHVAELGWTDIAFTTGVAQVLTESLGYKLKSDLLGLDVVYQALKMGKLDVFMGNWRPIQNEQFKQYFDEGSLDVLGPNLLGAKYTVAVPTYVADAGVKSFADLAKFGDRFDYKIYGIEPGSNQPLIDAVQKNEFGLGKWKVVESSEQGMLTQVDKAYRKQKWIAFMGWEPHAMNVDYNITYLSDGDDIFGANFGSSDVYTLSRKGYAQQCPNIAKLFQNLQFKVEFENHGIQAMLKQGKSATAAATEMMRKNPDLVKTWLNGVTTLDGQDGLAAVRKKIGS
ncbi:choline ABC transporter substrate-binding protein [Dongia soli]|uniref:Choline ABC transporter substrate-binding protein n=1 Tax=Dongia soli TaxID=600628 RepID=A0ABU5EBP5_9PROT|nr:choline ABC transporter substrate-binding protein [Dongia soli]MDY0882888.1 choline ABC transporter substrate-binding protein [Dongia soli]